MRVALGVLFFILGCFSSSWAGDKARNGGSVVSCGDSYEVLDLYEAHSLYGMALAIPEGRDELFIVDQVLNRLAGVEPQRAARLKELAAKFYQESRFTQEGLTTINDIGEGGVNLPEGCLLIQTVSQSRLLEPVGARYVIDAKVWKKLSLQNRAVMILHELIYRDAFEQNNRMSDSQGLRYYNALLFSEVFSKGKVNSRAYIIGVKGAGFQFVEYRGYSLMLHSGNSYPWGQLDYRIDFYPNGDVQSASLDSQVPLADGQPSLACEGDLFVSSEKIRVQFAQQEGWAQLRSQCTMTLKKAQGAHSYTLSSRFIEVDAERRVKWVSLSWDENKKNNFFHFLSDDWLIQGHVKSGYGLFWNNGNIQIIEASHIANEPFIVIYQGSVQYNDTDNDRILLTFDESGHLQQ